MVKKLLILLSVTLGVLALLWSTRTQPQTAEMVQVTQGSITRQVGITGRVSASQEIPVTALTEGIVEEVLVRDGARVVQGQALLRISGTRKEEAVSAVLAAGKTTPALSEVLSGLVLRAPATGNLQLTTVTTNSPVTAGMMAGIVLSGDQVIRCLASERDAMQLTPGMMARISCQGEKLGWAQVMEVGSLTTDRTSGMTTAQIVLRPEETLPLPYNAAVEAVISVETHHGVPTLPLSALTDRETVWWVCDGCCTEIDARIVQCDENTAWVDLPEGITVALGEFTEGQPLKEVSR